MGTRSRIASLAALAAAGAEVLTQIDFTALGAVSWIGESTVLLDGNTWTLYNSSSASAFGPDGSALECLPNNGTLWNVGTMTAPGLWIPLSTLDPSVDDLARYQIITEIPSWPTDQANYCALMPGWWDEPSVSRYYTSTYGPRYASGNNLYGFEGNNTWYNQGSTTSERSLGITLERGGVNIAACSDSQTYDPHDLIPDMGLLNGGSVSGNLSGARLLKPTTAWAGMAFVGKSSGSPNANFRVSRVTVLKFSESP
mgnify:CR=1 FL=1